MKSFVIVLLLAGNAWCQQTPLAIDDLYRFDALGQLVEAPGGESGIAIRSWIDLVSKRDRYSMWRIPAKAGKATPVEESEPDARLAMFSPDGKWIAFLSTRPRPKGWKQTPAAPPESDAATDVWLIPAAGGKAIPLAGPDKPYGRVFNDGFYGRVAFSQDGGKLVFIADDGADPRTPEESANDVLIVRPDQGEGYTGYGPAQIWIAHLDANPGEFAAGKIERLTKDDVWYGDPQWSPDGKTLAVHANKTKERESVRFCINRNFDIWAIDVGSGKQTQLTTGPGPDVSPRFSPDGKQLVCLSVPRKGSHRDVFNLVTITLDGAKPRVLLDNYSIETPPYTIPAFPLPRDCWAKESTLYFNMDDGIRNKVLVLDPDVGGKAKEKKLAATKANIALPPANPWLENRLLARHEIVAWENEGWKLDGILTTPPLGKAPFPLIVYPHGGPHSRWAEGFDFTVQIFAAHGYAVFQPNFRGSHGYGQKFIDADRGDFGGGDMRDVLTGVDMLIKKGIADADRQFVYGSSYGGFMTTWLIAHTKQFKAAVAQNPLTDLTMMWGLSDIQSYTEWEFRGTPWQVPDAMAKHSPLSHVGKVQTPTLLLQSREDRRCPPAMARAYYQSLLARSVPTQMVLYPGEGHGIKQPRHRVDVLRRVLAWFAQHEKK